MILSRFNNDLGVEDREWETWSTKTKTWRHFRNVERCFFKKKKKKEKDSIETLISKHRGARLPRRDSLKRKTTRFELPSIF